VSFQVHEETVPALIPHAEFGAPQCCGRLHERIVMKTAGIICNECREMIRIIPLGDLRRALDEMELQLEVATGLCNHCGAVDLFPGFSRVEAFVCETCGKGNS
jgi:hypothetical protein